MHFEWDLLITLGILVFIGFWVASKMKKQTMADTLEDFKELVKWDEVNQ